MDSKVAIISQARFSSTRLVGKVLMEIMGKTLLEYHLERLKLAEFPIVVATAHSKDCEPINDVYRKLGVDVYRGSGSDVLGRYYEAAKTFKVDIVVRVTADCPFIDGSLIKKGVELYLNLNDQRVFLSNNIEATYPVGMDFEVFSVESLEETFYQAHLPEDREHVSPFLRRNLSKCPPLV